MKYHPFLKGLAIFLAAVSLVACCAGGLGTLLLESEGLYSIDLNTWCFHEQQSSAEALADRLLRRYTAQTLSNCPEILLTHLDYLPSDLELADTADLEQNQWEYQITDSQQNTVSAVSYFREPGTAISHSFTFRTNYPVLLAQWEVNAPPQTVNIDQDNGYVMEIDGQEYYFQYAESPAYTVTIGVSQNALHHHTDFQMQWVSLLYRHRYVCVGAFALGLACFLLLMVYLCFAAGRSSEGQQLQVGGLNRLPLDLYFVLGGLCIFGLCVVSSVLFKIMLDSFRQYSSISWGMLSLGGVLLLLAVIVGVCFLFALAAQVKMKNRFWWRNSLLGRFCQWAGRLLLLPLRGCRNLFSLLPLIWQWLLTAVLMALVPLLFFGWAWNSSGARLALSLLCFFFSILVDIALVLYGAYAFGLLRKGAKEMSQGNLNTKIPTKYLYGPFRDCGENLNALADTAVLAAQKQMKSERMKTELITNISHDIKTPLTSLINYVDLLEKPHTPEEGAQYLDVLHRQSLRLKKLIDDLMDMSKASTGNMTVSATRLELAEAVTQALGEFADKLQHADLQVVFPPPEQPTSILADGRLTWRVLSNLLSNIVKYALPGTRVYLDLCHSKEGVQLSLKNISREPLNISADELTERFVRGDASRNTEGSGLGLNIAMSLMELQKGHLALLVDGDLFKVTLTFPSAE